MLSEPRKYRNLFVKQMQCQQHYFLSSDNKENASSNTCFDNKCNDISNTFLFRQHMQGQQQYFCCSNNIYNASSTIFFVQTTNAMSVAIFSFFQTTNKMSVAILSFFRQHIQRQQQYFLCSDNIYNDSINSFYIQTTNTVQQASVVLVVMCMLSFSMQRQTKEKMKLIANRIEL